MKLTLTVKVIGQREEISRLVKFLEKGYFVIMSSRLLRNERDDGFHLFLNLLPKREVTEAST